VHTSMTAATSSARGTRLILAARRCGAREAAVEIAAVEAAAVEAAVVEAEAVEAAARREGDRTCTITLSSTCMATCGTSSGSAHSFATSSCGNNIDTRRTHKIGCTGK
jgi:hypothetical protein